MAVTIRSVVFDCSDAAALASFYAALLGGQLNVTDPNWCVVTFGDVSPKLAFQRVGSYVSPDWPDGAPQQVHLDLTVPDIEEASHPAGSRGARVLGERVEEPGGTYLVHTDPAGHPFCLWQQRA
jgi:predicted enzyme related to lactoylglutathione lyase